MSFQEFLVDELEKLVVQRDGKIKYLEEKVDRVGLLLKKWRTFTYTTKRCTCCDKPMLTYYNDKCVVMTCINCDVLKEHDCTRLY